MEVDDTQVCKAVMSLKRLLGGGEEAPSLLENDEYMYLVRAHFSVSCGFSSLFCWYACTTVVVNPRQYPAHSRRHLCRRARSCASRHQRNRRSPFECKSIVIVSLLWDVVLGHFVPLVGFPPAMELLEAQPSRPMQPSQGTDQLDTCPDYFSNKTLYALDKGLLMRILSIILLLYFCSEMPHGIYN